MEPLNLETKLKNHFLGWQCRIRQIAIRETDGKPTAGMRPFITVDDDKGPIAQITVLINKLDSQGYTTQFRHIFKKTHDPAERFSAAVKLLSSAYFQKPHEFSDELTGLFNQNSTLAHNLIDHQRCRLAFKQYNQRYLLDCWVRNLPKEESNYQATFWHNSLFNNEVPAGVHVLAFRPNWAKSLADPPAT